MPAVFGRVLDGTASIRRGDTQLFEGGAGRPATRYKHAARHLLECRSLAASIRDFGEFETHEAFVSRLRARHGRKTGFWSQVSELTGG